MKFEQLTSRRIIRSAAFALALGVAVTGLASCGASEDTSHNAVETESIQGPRVTQTYFDDGSRLTDYKNDNEDYSDVFSYCDGLDLVDQTSYNYKSGNAIDRSVAHPACADGKLTPADFKIAG